MNGRPTLEQIALVSIVVVGGPDTLIEAARRCAGDVSRGARVVRTQLANAANAIARERPFAIVLSDELYEFDAEEFDALARDVKAMVLALPTARAPMQALYERLVPLLRDAFREHFRR
jgi:hypothetical protein